MTDRTAVVTGASSGIGAATARAPRRRGLPRGLRRPPRATGSRRWPRRSAATAVALRRHRRRRRSPRSPPAVGPRLDVLVNNAGGAFGAAPVAEADADDWRADVRGQRARRCCGSPRRCCPRCRAAATGVIVNVGSTAGRIAYEGGGGYTAAKHGTQVVTETLRLELVASRCGSCEIAPGHGADRRVRAGPLRRRPRRRPTRCTPAWPSRWSPRTSPTRSPGWPPGPRT